MSITIRPIRPNIPAPSMDDIEAELLSESEWDQIEERLSKTERRDAYSWTDKELEILRRARAKGYSYRQILESGVLPSRTLDAIRGMGKRVASPQ